MSRSGATQREVKTQKGASKRRRSIPVPIVGGYEHAYDKTGREFWDAIRQCDAVADYLLTHGLFSVPDPAVLFTIIEEVAKRTGNLHESDRGISKLVKALEGSSLSPDQQKE